MHSIRIIIHLLLVSISFSFLSGCEYSDHYEEQIKEKNLQISMLSDTIPYFTWVHLWVLPDLERLKELNLAIEKAQDRIWIEIYSWTEKSLLDEVIAAKWRGVDIRVILEGNVYGSPEINRSTYKKLKSAGITVKYADNGHFTFTHAKFWIIDSSYFISTGNFSHAAFTSNRELILSWQDSVIKNNLEKIFLSDSSYHLYTEKTIPGLVISPISMRSGIESLMASATQSINIYVQSFTDEHLLELLQKKVNAGISVTLCMADKWDDDGSDDLALRKLSGSGIFIKKIKKPYPHLKFINIDNTIWFIGSTNLTQNALDNNREIWLIFHPESILKEDLLKIPVSECPTSKK